MGPETLALHLPLATPSCSYFSRESPFAGPSCVSSLAFLIFSIFSLSSQDLDVFVPSFCSSLVVRGREIKNARCWSCGGQKIKCCYQLRYSEKHDLFQEEELLLLKEGSSTSTSV